MTAPQPLHSIRIRSKPHADLALHLRLKFRDAVLHGHSAAAAALDQLARSDAQLLGQFFDFDPFLGHRRQSFAGQCVRSCTKLRRNQAFTTPEGQVSAPARPTLGAALSLFVVALHSLRKAS